jgi:hypothetical protein
VRADEEKEASRSNVGEPRGLSDAKRAHRMENRKHSEDHDTLSTLSQAAEILAEISDQETPVQPAQILASADRKGASSSSKPDPRAPLAVWRKPAIPIMALAVIGCVILIVRILYRQIIDFVVLDVGFQRGNVLPAAVSLLQCIYMRKFTNGEAVTICIHMVLALLWLVFFFAGLAFLDGQGGVISFNGAEAADAFIIVNILDYTVLLSGGALLMIVASTWLAVSLIPPYVSAMTAEHELAMKEYEAEQRRVRRAA